MSKEKNKDIKNYTTEEIRSIIDIIENPFIKAPNKGALEIDDDKIDLLYDIYLDLPKKEKRKLFESENKKLLNRLVEKHMSTVGFYMFTYQNNIIKCKKNILKKDRNLLKYIQLSESQISILKLSIFCAMAYERDLFTSPKEKNNKGYAYYSKLIKEYEHGSFYDIIRLLASSKNGLIPIYMNLSQEYIDSIMLLYSISIEAVNILKYDDEKFKDKNTSNKLYRMINENYDSFTTFKYHIANVLYDLIYNITELIEK